MDIQTMADYYLALSDKLDAGHSSKPAYSLDFFYGSDITDANGKIKGSSANITSNELLNAFFGDRTAFHNIETVRDDELTDDELSRFAINGSYLNDAQRDAVKKALSNRVTIIQGPPGTGKTEVILNILSCILKKYPQRTAMLMSGNYEAVKNITDKINEGKDDNRLLGELYNSYLPLGNKSARKAVYEERRAAGLDVSFFDTGTFRVNKARLGEIRFLSSTVHSVKNLYTNENDGNCQYDYVIVDECSQVSILLGLIALSCGKRVILLGDREQLAPVIRAANVDEINREYANVPDVYKEMPEKSFLEVCESVFGNIGDSCAFLDGHYRCHPSIINFCNKFVYDGKLKVCTYTGRNGMPEADKLMMRLLWYEGDYYEIREREVVSKDDPNDRHREKYKINERQLDIFMREEFPRIADRLKNDKSYSVCVMSPYNRDVIKELAERIGAACAELREEIGISDEESDLISELTIHKAQGKGFDSVWLLPIEDVGSEYRWPWSQQKRMINVAVSRAKKEFTVITSSSWMPDKLQYELTESCELKKPDDSAGEKDNLMINKLFGYVANDCADLDRGGIYGIRKAKTSSIFDKTLYYRRHFANCGGENPPSAPERIMMDHLIEKYSRDYDILNEIPFSAYSPRINPAECRSDFAICRGSDVLVIIEVDGEFHRSDCEQAERDRLKDAAIAAAGTDTVNVRISTNDLNVEETIEAALNAALAGHRFITVGEAEKKAAMERCVYSRVNGYLTSVLREVIFSSFEDFCADYRQGNNRAAIRSNNYTDPDENDFRYDDKQAVDYYLCRYGMCYAFEYSLIYSLVLKSMANSGERLDGLLSFGCGSMIDGWAMAYANNAVNSSSCRLAEPFGYMGVDCAKWARRFIEEKTEGDAGELPDYMRSFSEVGFFLGTVTDYLDTVIAGSGEIRYNVICFPKILNELGDAAVNEMAERFEKIKFPLDEYYICASHSRSKYTDGDRQLEKIVGSINRTGEFEVTYDLEKMNISEDSNIIKAIYPRCRDELVSVSDPEYAAAVGDVSSKNSCYIFKSCTLGDPKKIISFGSVDRSFAASKVVSTLADMASKDLDYPEEKDRVRNSFVKVSKITFQIVKLRRRR